MEYSEHLDYVDGKLFWKNARRGVTKGAEAGCPTGHGYKTFMLNRKKTYVHRAVWEMHNGTIPDGFVVDHIDRDRSNNRVENLRVVTHKQNCSNQSARGFWIMPNGKYYAYCNSKYLGVFGCETAAKLAHLRAKRETY